MSTSLDEVRIPALTLGWRLKMALGGEVSVQEMADYLGVSRQTLARWTTDQHVPARAYILQWAMRTGTDPVWLETGIVVGGDPSAPATSSSSDSSDSPTSSYAGSPFLALAGAA